MGVLGAIELGIYDQVREAIYFRTMLKHSGSFEQGPEDL